MVENNQIRLKRIQQRLKRIEENREMRRKTQLANSIFSLIYSTEDNQRFLQSANDPVFLWIFSLISAQDCARTMVRILMIEKKVEELTSALHEIHKKWPSLHLELYQKVVDHCLAN